eukprot:TRINITY_DN26787_c0_g1_i1.p1 TRINITY_DN26787_c0_g1~~TRINITY_DN26787_c0_g1_i1.p1  ORF type:complete len:492 (+),score=152.75 TRINITY_DN26787_c0_g1_i1:89-1477(+)
MGAKCPGCGPPPADVTAVDTSYPPYGLCSVVAAREPWVRQACGDFPYYCTAAGATFGCDHDCPRFMPDFSHHFSSAAQVLQQDPGLWERLRTLRTQQGATLADCIKPAVDCRDHPQLRSAGAVACDEASYETFRELFDAVIAKQHLSFDPAATPSQASLSPGPEPAALPLQRGVSGVPEEGLDKDRIEALGRRIISVRADCRRNVRGFRLSPLIGFEERRELEAQICAALEQSGGLDGVYCPLQGSRSRPSAPQGAGGPGMSEEKTAQLRRTGMLLQLPEQPRQLSAGVARHWPDARGVWHNRRQDLFIWVGGTDHVRVIAVPKVAPPRIQRTVHTCLKGCEELQKGLRARGRELMHSERLGYITPEPAHLGAALCCYVVMRLPLLSARPDWKPALTRLGLKGRMMGRPGDWELSNAPHGNVTPDSISALLAAGCATLAVWEDDLEAGKEEQVAAEMAQAGA